MMQNAKVQCFYLGGLGAGGFVSTRGAVFPLPPVGGSFEVPSYLVKPLLERYPNALSINPNDAAQADKEIQRKRDLAFSLQKLPEELTKADVYELLAQFNFIRPDEMPEELSGLNSEPAFKRRGRPRKVSDVEMEERDDGDERAS